MHGNSNTEFRSRFTDPSNLIEVSVAHVFVVSENWITAAHGCFLYTSVSQIFFKWGPLSLVRMFYGPPYSWDYQTH